MLKVKKMYTTYEVFLFGFVLLFIKKYYFIKLLRNKKYRSW